MSERPQETPASKGLQCFAQDVRLRLSPWVEELVLFGSRARGTAAPWSDWDVLAVTQCRDRDRESELIDLAFEQLLRERINISVKWITREKRDQQVRAGASFMMNVLRDGRSLWTRTTKS